MLLRYDNVPRTSRALTLARQAGGYLTSPFAKSIYSGVALQKAYNYYNSRNAVKAVAAAAARKYSGYSGKSAARSSGRRMAYSKKYAKSRVTKRKSSRLSKRLSNVERKVRASQGILTYRYKNDFALNSTIGNTVYAFYSVNNVSNMELALAQLRYYDISTPATLVNADGTSGSFLKKFLFKNIYGSLTLRNNYQVPAKVTVYIIRVKDDTSISASTAFTNGLADIGNPSSTSPLVYPTDSGQFNQMWRIMKTCRATLAPGKSMTALGSVKDVMYDPSLTDSHALEYQTRNKMFGFLVRLEGIVGHDTTVATEQGVLPCGVDIDQRYTMTIHYDAGADIKYIHVVDASDTAFTNAAVVSSQPVSDNIGYSIA